MEAIEFATRHHPSFALDADHASVMPPSNASALYARLLLNPRRRSGLESYQRLVQDGNLGATTQEMRSRSGANDNGTSVKGTVSMNDTERHDVKGQGNAVLVVSDAKIGHHSHHELDDPEMAPAPSRFAFPLPPLFTIEQHKEHLTLSNIIKGRPNKSPSTPPSSFPRHRSPSKYPIPPTPPPQSLQPHLPQKSLHRSPASMATLTLDRSMLPPNASDVSDMPLDCFAEGEVLDVESSDNDAWGQSPYRYPSKLRLGARCSSSTLYDETRPPSSQGSWSKHTKDDGCDQLHTRNTYSQSPMKQTLTQSTDDDANSNMAWMARSKTEPSQGNNNNNNNNNDNSADSGVDNTQGSSPLSTPITPSIPTPADLDKTTKNLMMFNRIPRQWPASQETLHHNYLASAGPTTPVIRDFDAATAERIERVINRERPLSRVARERLAAEQKEVELEARGFFDPARRFKGRDVYPRPSNWVYCRRTKNNWFEKTKILADQYKLLKGQVLGKGHHADVYKGIDLTTGQDLAIKVVYKTISRRMGFVREDPMQEVKNRRLLNEAWFIDFLKDAPGICKLVRVIETATKFYFVMELAQSDLNSYSNGINMREEEIRHILKPIFECLKYAHSQDITHRDIKPENILLTTQKDWMPTNTKLKSKSSKQTLQANGQLDFIDDSSSILASTFANESSFLETMDGRSSIDNYDHRFDSSLADWGLAVEHDCNSGRKPVGTPLYAAPEVVRKMKRIRRREWINYRACDMWSLGVTMFVIASGIYPYHTHDALEAQAPPNWGMLESSGMSREYIEFTQRLMNLTAELRPSAAEACNDSWLQD